MDNRITQILALTRGPRVLDVGCVGGLQIDEPPVNSPLWVHRHLIDAFEEVWGIDLSPTRIDKVRELGVTNVHVADAQDFSLDQTFETIVAGELIEHLPKPAAFLRSARRHLAPNGRLIVTTPYVFGIESVLYAWFKYPQTCPNPEHTVWFCPRTLRTFAALEGFDVIELRMIPDDRRPERASPYNLALFAQWVLQGILPARVKTKTMIAVLKPMKRVSAA